MSRMAMLWTTLVKNSVLLFHTVVFVIAMLPASVKKAAPGAPAVEAWYFTRLDHIVFTALMALAQYYKHTRAYLFVKPLPMFFLIYRTLFVASTPASSAILAGLVFGVVGDIILVFARRWRPALSLGGIAFLIGHTAYVLAFVRFPLSAGREVWVAWLGLFLIFMHEYYYFMLKHAPALEFFFGVIYWVSISVMFVSSINAEHYIVMHVGHRVFPYALTGSFLFLLSDFCIHWVVYVESDNHFMERMILPLYYVGQMLLCQSAISFVEMGV